MCCCGMDLSSSLHRPILYFYIANHPSCQASLLHAWPTPTARCVCTRRTFGPINTTTTGTLHLPPHTPSFCTFALPAVGLTAPADPYSPANSWLNCGAVARSCLLLACAPQRILARDALPRRTALRCRRALPRAAPALMPAPLPALCLAAPTRAPRCLISEAVTGRLWHYAWPEQRDRGSISNKCS